MPKPTPIEFANYYTPYIALTNGETVIELINNHSHAITKYLQNIPTALENFAYAENKWTVKELIQHLLDVERVFVYRILRFSRKDLQPLLGFEEDDYILNAEDLKNKTLADIIDELIALRKSSDILFKHLTTIQLQQIGIANNNNVTVNALVYICFGHLLHHINVLKERYHIQ